MNSAPVRVQRKRSKGWRMPENTVYVGRPSKWGNPYIPSNDEERPRAAAFYREWLEELRRRGLAHDLEELRGKNLACWCPLDEPCHADILLELANK